ncbi:MAG: OmpA family protein [Bacteroidales bacterium]|nr:OmpA family protein [Bacteroidales bacterium]
MYYCNSFLKLAFAAALLLTGSSVRAQIIDRPWYAGVQGGTSFGQSTFSSITEHQIHWGLQGGLFAGYRINRVFSLEAAFQYGAQTQAALDCCPYWLSAVDGTRFAVAVLDEPGWYYKDLSTRTQWGRAALQANVNLIGIFAKNSRWALNLSPQIAAVTTQTKLITPDKTTLNPRQWHLSYGGQVSLGYRISDRIGAALYGGVAGLAGERFDNMPYHGHDTNLLWDAGVKLSFHFGKYPKKGPSAAELEAARLAAEEAARAAREAEEARLRAAEEAARAEAAAREIAAREEAERLAREQAEREAADARERAFRTPIPTVYFANDSKHVVDTYDAGLEEALAILQQYPDFNLEIHAYCSRSGSKAYNEKLSEQRMEAVRAWFAEHGISTDRMAEAYFHGIDYNAPSADEARRAELKFVK